MRSRKAGAMLPQQQMQSVSHHRLVVALRPAHDLFDPHRPGFRNFFVALRAVLVDGFPAVQQQPVSEVGVLGQGVVVPAADFAQSAQPHAGNRASMLRHQTQVHARLLVYLIAAGALQIQKTREQDWCRNSSEPLGPSRRRLRDQKKARLVA